ncbi:MAG: twin-arginine translocase TatA/TatE family subunit [Methylococcus sp.]
MGIGIWELGLIILIVMLLFGTQRLRTVGGDLGATIKGFKIAMRDDDHVTPTARTNPEVSKES